MPKATDRQISMSFNLFAEPEGDASARIDKKGIANALNALAWKFSPIQVVALIQSSGLVVSEEQYKIEEDAFSLGFEDYVKVVEKKVTLQTKGQDAERAFRVLADPIKNSIEVETLLTLATVEGFNDPALHKSIGTTIRQHTGGSSEITEEMWMSLLGLRPFTPRSSRT